MPRRAREDPYGRILLIWKDWRSRDAVNQVLCSQPCRTAYLTMSMRPFRPSFRIALALCASTVLTLSDRRDGDLLVAVAGGDQPQHLRLALADASPLGCWFALALLAEEPGGDPRGQRGVEVLAAGRRGANRLEQLGGRALLQHVARHARAQQLLQVGVVAVPRQRDDRRRRAAAASASASRRARSCRASRCPSR